MANLQITYRPLETLIPYARNSRTHSATQIDQIAASIREFGWANPILVDGKNGIIAGHGRLLAARQLGISEVPVIELSHLTEVQKRAYIIADNKLAELAGWDDELLALELGELKTDGFDVDLLGFDAVELDQLLPTVGDEKNQKEASATLAERFLVTPLSVFNAREGWWQQRKQAWFALGLSSEDGRNTNLAYTHTAQPLTVYKARDNYIAKMGRGVSWKEFYEANPEMRVQKGTSIFDPVLCEIVYRWFCPPDGTVLDPFAGGSVRGVVAAMLGRQYVGCDLREKQVQANREQWSEIDSDTHPTPVWHCGDSIKIDQHAKGVQADLVFSCPPYADLEKYSEDPADLSNMSYDDFLNAYREIIRKSVALLKNDRFACFVVGEVRDREGIYRNFIADTIQAFIDAGMHYYNEAILVTKIGSLAMRAGRTFTTSRKLGKTHQNALIFVKGDARRATQACGSVEIDDSLFSEAIN